MPIEKFDIEKFIHEAEFDYFRFYLDFCRGFKNNEDILPKEKSSCPDNLRYNLYMEAATNTKPTA